MFSVLVGALWVALIVAGFAAHIAIDLRNGDIVYAQMHCVKIAAASLFVAAILSAGRIRDLFHAAMLWIALVSSRKRAL